MPSLWTQMWFLPKATIRQIVDTDPRQQMPLLIFLAGIAQALTSAAGLGMGEQLSLFEMIAFCLIFGPLSTFLVVVFGGLLLHRIAQFLHGVASAAETRAAIAWSWVPIITILPLWIVRYIFFGEELFKLKKTAIESTSGLSVLYESINLIEFAVVIWGALLLYSALAEVNQFSAWRGFLAVVLSITAFFVPLFFLSILFALF
ncbi:MAG TPA: YIP1 family protein [bacterium]|nr:YIP1 family protein [bacterium]HPG45384.1 YIP1 family protein [bacterium]HPM96840.1 YIP1 family protein [bacterium]